MIYFRLKDYPHDSYFIDKYKYPFENAECLDLLIDDLAEQIAIPFDTEYIKCKFNPIYLSLHTWIIPSHIKYIELYVSLSDLYGYLSNGKIDISIMEFENSSNIIGMNIYLNTGENWNKDTYKMYKLVYPKLITCIPKTIEYLKINFFITNIAEYENLKTFIYTIDDYSIDYDDKGDYDGDDCDITVNFNNLPNGLIRLEIEDSDLDCSLDNLPPDLKFLSIEVGSLSDYCEGYKYSLDNLPAGLEVLFFPQTIRIYDDNSNANINNLPSSLKFLCLPQYLADTTDFNNLPDSLEILDVWNYSKIIEKMNRYPKNLKKLYTHYVNDDPYSNTINDQILEIIKNNQFLFEIYHYDRFENVFRLVSNN